VFNQQVQEDWRRIMVAKQDLIEAAKSVHIPTCHALKLMSQVTQVPYCTDGDDHCIGDFEKLSQVCVCGLQAPSPGLDLAAGGGPRACAPNARRASRDFMGKETRPRRPGHRKGDADAQALKTPQNMPEKTFLPKRPVAVRHPVSCCG
jgi:hypothetical protein